MPEFEETAERQIKITIAIITAMFLFWKLGFGFFKYTTFETPDGYVPYNITTLHVFVVFAALILSLRYSLLVGVSMGVFSSVNWHELLQGHIEPLMYINYFVPRVLIPVVTRSTFGKVVGWKYRPLALGLTAVAGTATNTIGYGILLALRITDDTPDVEVQSLGLTIAALVQIVIRHFPIEAAMCVAFLVSLYYARGVFEASRSEAMHASQDTLRKWDLFIAHAAPDAPDAEALYKTLKMEYPNLRVFLDTREVAAGADWDLELGHAQQHSKATVVLVSDRTNEAYYQRNEIVCAIKMARSENHLLIPIFLTPDTKTPYGLDVKQRIEYNKEEGYGRVAKDIANALLHRNA